MIVVPAGMETLFPLKGTIPPTQLAPEDHKPPLAEAEYVTGAFETKLISSTEAGGLAISETSDFQLKTKR